MTVIQIFLPNIRSLHPTKTKTRSLSTVYRGNLGSNDVLNTEQEKFPDVPFKTSIHRSSEVTHVMAFDAPFNSTIPLEKKPIIIEL